MQEVIEKLKKNRAFLCLECGKCTAVCPVSSFNKGYSPRRMLAEGLFYGAADLLTDKLLWSCLTCQLCSQRCPVDVRYSDYMRDIRTEAYRLGEWGNPSHGGALLYIMEMATAPKLKQSRTAWVDKSLKVKNKGEVLYFVGCLPYYQDFFAKDFDFVPVSIAQDTVKILNRLGIEPVVLDNERCCGHDLYWLGQLDKFDELGRLNIKEIEESGAKTVVTACPECALVLKKLYPERLGSVGCEVKHISEVVAENIDRLKFNDVAKEISYQDPCRLGRFLGIYDQPREVLSAIPGISLHEMPRSRRGAICCGTTNWMNCDAYSGQIQRSRLKEARAAGAETLVTACPKCQIHFRCSECGAETEKVDIKLTDFVNIIASALTG
ncbi:MAG: (Fe-S)-binding protein [Candidatus Zixiibacteriota bacterium]|nr:MAG: (Fe-S)-binding protein [candidate division Zixibacteria bacterium]